VVQEERELERLQEKDEWIDQLEESLQAYESELVEKYARIDELERLLAQKPPSTSSNDVDRSTLVDHSFEDSEKWRGRVLHLVYRSLQALPRLVERKYIGTKVKALLNPVRARPDETLPIEVSQTRLHEHSGLRLDTQQQLSRPVLFTHPHLVQSADRGRVLVIDHRLPTPDRDCGSLRMMELIRAILGRGHHITFIPDNFFVWPPYLQDLEAIGVEVVHPPEYRFVAQFLKERGRDFDLAIISRAGIAARHLTTVRRYAPRARIVFDTVDLHFLREERQARLVQDSALESAGASRKRQELRLARRADLTVVVSPVEKALLQTECPDFEVMVIPTIYPVEATDPPGFSGRKNLVFIGGFAHAPNIDAVLYFANEIFPLIHSRIRHAVFQIIGSDPPPEIVQLASANIEVLGYVADVKPIFDRARVSVAPIRFGAGVKGKVNQSMALGVPSVITSVAAEGMYLAHEHDAMIADDPESFADAVVRVWNSRVLWERLSINGRRNLREHFSVEAAAKPIDEMLEWAGLTNAAQDGRLPRLRAARG
jgi:glycosyltransferase involved in cell wall biosynthesis